MPARDQQCRQRGLPAPGRADQEDEPPADVHARRVDERVVEAGVVEHVLDGAPLEERPGVAEGGGAERGSRGGARGPGVGAGALQPVAEGRRGVGDRGRVVEDGDGGGGEVVVGRELDDVGRERDPARGAYRSKPSDAKRRNTSSMSRRIAAGSAAGMPWAMASAMEAGSWPPSQNAQTAAAVGLRTCARSPTGS